MTPAKKKPKKPRLILDLGDATRHLTPPEDEYHGKKHTKNDPVDTIPRAIHPDRESPAWPLTPESPRFQEQQYPMVAAPPSSDSSMALTGPSADPEYAALGMRGRREALRRYEESERQYLNTDNRFIDEETKQELVHLAKLAGGEIESELGPNLLVAAHGPFKSNEVVGLTFLTVGPEFYGNSAQISSEVDKEVVVSQRGRKVGSNGAFGDVGGGVMGHLWQVPGYTAKENRT